MTTPSLPLTERDRDILQRVGYAFQDIGHMPYRVPLKAELLSQLLDIEDATTVSYVARRLAQCVRVALSILYPETAEEVQLEWDDEREQLERYSNEAWLQNQEQFWK